MLQFDPFIKNASSKSKVSFNISGIDGNNGRGKKTGVDLRWHTQEEYRALTKEAQSELREWQSTKNGKAAVSKQQTSYFKEKKRKRQEKSSTSSGKRHKAQIAALEKVVAEKNALLEQKQQEAEVLAVVKETAQSGGKSDKMNLSAVRSIMKIVARQSKS